MSNNFLDEDDDLKPAYPEGKQPPFASFWSRVAAAVLDAAIFVPLILVSQYNILTLKSLPLEMLLTCASIVYKPYMEYQFGATIGKMTMKIQVVNEQFGAITSDQSIKRFSFFFIGYLATILLNYWLFTHPDFQEAVDYIALNRIQKSIYAEFVSNVATIPIFVSIISVIFDSKKQALHDQFAKTYCIDIRGQKS